MSWYRTYRPTNVSQLHLHSVREQLQQLLQRGKLPQVVLLAGPKGSGKTSTARILASTVNDPANAAAVDQLFTRTGAGDSLQEPNAEDELVRRIQQGRSYVVQELDAASNRGIDEVRRLKEEVALPPQEGKVKVYILDEVHMFTTEAFNALLKLLEEPPAHVMFVLATTELHKIPDTIASRSTLIPFHKATTAELVEALEHIVTQEKITTDPEALERIAAFADGSFRDAVKMAEVLFNQHGELTSTAVSSLEQGYQPAQLSRLLELILQKDAVELAQYFEQARQLNLNSQEFFRRFLEFLYQELVLSLDPKAKSLASSAALLYLLKALMVLPARETGPIPFLSLEITLLDIVLRSKKQAGDEGSRSSSGNGSGRNSGNSSTSSAEHKASNAQDVAPTLDAADFADSITTSSLKPIINANPQPVLYSDNLKPLHSAPDTIQMSSSKPGDSQKLFDEWKTFINLVEQEHTGVSILLRSAKPMQFNDASATVAVYYAFHKQCLDEPKTKQILATCIENIAGGPVKLEFIVAPSDEAGSAREGSDDALVELAQDMLV